ncbi:MAG: hypothetical protein V1495_07430 [Pseudomonadota bacterium]
MIRRAFITILLLLPLISSAAEAQDERSLCRRSFLATRTDLNFLERGFWGSGMSFENELTSDQRSYDLEGCVAKAVGLYGFLGKPMRTPKDAWTKLIAVEFHYVSHDSLPEFRVDGRIQIPGAEGNLPFPTKKCIRADLLNFLPDSYRPYILERAVDDCTDRQFHLIVTISGKPVEIGGEIRTVDLE